MTNECPLYFHVRKGYFQTSCLGYSYFGNPISVNYVTFCRCYVMSIACQKCTFILQSEHLVWVDAMKRLRYAKYWVRNRCETAIKTIMMNINPIVSVLTVAEKMAP